MESEKKRKVLVIDDNPTNLALLKVYLRRMGLIPLLAGKPALGMDMAFREHPDLILLDVMMPDIDGYEICRRLKADARTADIPVIFVSARSESEDIIAGLELGAVDYITKPFKAGELKARIGAVCRMADLHEKLAAQASTDELTGLANRRRFCELLEHAVTRAKSRTSPLSLLIFDLDHFKNINDTYGHLGGDVVLRQFAHILVESVYPDDIAARYGGEEFAVIMPETAGEKAVKAAERIRRSVENCRWKVSTERVSVTVSVGVGSLEIHETLIPDELIKRADTALYRAKQHGRNRIVRWDRISADTHLLSRDVTDLQNWVVALGRQLSCQALGSITPLAKTIDARDNYAADRLLNVQTYARAIADELGLAANFKERLEIASCLHDLGMVVVPDHVLNNAGPLTAREREIVERHPVVTVRIIEPLDIFHRELTMIRHHHEHFDGAGYPDALRGRKIPFGARILAMADSFEALTSDRPYRKARLCADARAEVVTCSGTQFDPDVVEAFLAALDKHTAQWPLVSTTAVGAV